MINKGYEVVIVDNLYNSEASVVDRIKATPHKDCAAETQLDFSSDCTEILQAYCRMAKNFCAR